MDDARRNAARNGIRNAEFLSGDLERIAGTLGQRLPRPDVVVVDPARAGLSSGVRDFLAASGARRVVYVRCDWCTRVFRAVAAAVRGERCVRVPLAVATRQRKRETCATCAGGSRGGRTVSHGCNHWTCSHRHPTWRWWLLSRGHRVRISGAHA